MPDESLRWIPALRVARRFAEAATTVESATALLLAARELGEREPTTVVVSDATNPDLRVAVTLDAAGVAHSRHVGAADLDAQLGASIAHLRADAPDLGGWHRTEDAGESPVRDMLLDLCATTNERIGDGGRQRLAASAAMALRHVADGVVFVGEDKVIRVWTHAAERIIGIREEQAVGRRIDEVLEDWPRLSRYVHVVSKDVLGVEVRADPIPLSLPQGERWVEVRGVDVGEGSTVYTVRDASEERLRDQQLLDYVSTASHQLRTPIAAIHGAAHTLLRDDIDFAPEQQEQFLRMIVDGSDRLVQTVDAVIQASRIQGEFVPKSTEAVSVRDLVFAVVDPIARTDEHQVVVAIPEDLRVVIDSRALDVALSNLVENAIKYSPAGGTVTIGAARNRDSIQVTVADEGIGISSPELPRIFDKFYRADPDMREGIGGTGLGLYITAEVIDRAGGNVSVSSKPGHGTTFTVTLPATGMSKVEQIQRFRRSSRDRSKRHLRSDEAVSRLVVAIDDFNARAAHDEISHLFARYGRSLVVREALIPLLRAVGGIPNPPPDAIAREHFISNIIRGRLWSLTRDWQRSDRPQVLLACAPEEQHDLGLLIFGTALHELGWSVTWLGVRTPVRSLAHVVESVRPACVVVAALDPAALPERDEADLTALAARVPIFVGGAAAHDVTGRVDGAVALEGDPTDAAYERWFVETTLELQSRASQTADSGR